MTDNCQTTESKAFGGFLYTKKLLYLFKTAVFLFLHISTHILHFKVSAGLCIK